MSLWKYSDSDNRHATDVANTLFNTRRIFVSQTSRQEVTTNSYDIKRYLFIIEILDAAYHLVFSEKIKFLIKDMFPLSD